MAVVSFAEESCWDGEKRRARVKEVVFRVVSIGKIQGVRVDFTGTGSYDMWYDPEDAVTLDFLQSAMPAIDWEGLVFWKKADHSEIAIMDPMTDSQVGSITVRKRLGGDPAGEIDETNVVSYEIFARRRLEMEVGE